MQKPYLVGFRMNDKEKIKEAVEMLYQIGVDWQEDLEKSQLDRLSEVIHLLKSQKNDTN